MEQVVAMGFVVIATDDPCVNVRASIEALTGSKQPNGTFCPNHLETASAPHADVLVLGADRVLTST